MLPSDNDELSEDSIKLKKTSQLLAAWNATGALLSAEEDEENMQSMTLMNMGSILLNCTSWTMCLQCKYCDQIFYYIKHFVEHASRHLLTVGECDTQLLQKNAEKIDVHPDSNEQQYTTFDDKIVVKSETSSDIENENIDYMEDEYNDLSTSVRSRLNDDSFTKYAEIEYLQEYINELKFKPMDQPTPVEMQQYDDLTELKTNKSGKLECSACRIKFQSVRSLRSHIKQHMAGRALCCKWCTATFLDGSNLRVHVRRHLGMKPHSCEFCQKAFISTTELKLHMRTHTGERPYQCQYCTRSFTSSAHLKSHMRRHTNDRPYACNICEKRFYDRRLLRDHEATHSNVRPFVCEVCGSNFSRRKSLIEHYKLHSKVKRYHCNICGKHFAQNSGLYVHMRTHEHEEATVLKTEFLDSELTTDQPFL